MTAFRRLSLYHRPGCHLCDEMLEAVEMLCHGRNVVVEVVDIDRDAGLSAKYGRDIPVLTTGDTELCRHRLDVDRLREWLSSI